MTSAARMREREKERRLSIRTLVIAAIASATAAILTSHFWSAGTPIAAAVTPVIVALVSELLHRPTEVIAQRARSFTTEGDALPAAGGPAPPPPRSADVLPEHAPPEPGSEPEAGPVRVYRRPARQRRKIAVGVVVTTAVLAFAIAAAALTLPELITGGSIGKGDRNTTLWGGRDRKDRPEREEPVPTAPTDQPTETETVPQETETETVPTETQTTPTETETTPGKTP